MKKEKVVHSKVSEPKEPESDQKLPGPKVIKITDKDLVVGVVHEDQAKVKSLLEESTLLPLQDLRPAIDHWQHKSGRNFDVHKDGEKLVAEMK